MEELDYIYENYICDYDHDLTLKIGSFFDKSNKVYATEKHVKNQMASYFMTNFKIWHSLPSQDSMNKYTNKNINYVLISNDNSLEIHILVYRGKVVRVKAWHLTEKNT